MTVTSAADASDNSEQAQALFDEAKQLILQGRWTDACPKLAQSNQLDPRATTLFRLGECYENTGKKASAWNAYISSAAGAAAAGETKRAEFARDRAKRLEPTVPHLVITVNQRPVTIYEDGERIDEARWGTKIPVDPGEHVVVADAPGKQRFTATVVVIDAATTVLTIPPLADLPSSPEREAKPLAPASTSAPQPQHAEAPPPTDHRTLRKWSIILSGVGLASVGAGAAFTLTAPDSPDGCRGTCVAGTSLIIGGALVAATGLAFFLASLGDSSPPARASSRLRPFELRF